MSDAQFDLIVIGGGPGGYVAAIRASQLGMKTAVVERAHLGGVCLNWGCIPTKALLRSAEVYRLMQHADQFGLSARDISFDLKKVVDRSRKIASQLAAGVKHLLKKNKVAIIEGHARLTGRGGVAVQSETGAALGSYQAKHIILATGARARALPGLEPDEHLVWTARRAMTPDILPKSLLVIGSGAIGIEFANFYRALGVEVTVVEALDRILPVEDAEISTLARKAFEKQGMRILTSAQVGPLQRAENSVAAQIKVGDRVETITAERAILAVGIVGNVENIGLEQTRVRVEKTHILVNQWLETDEPGVYAIGDVAGPPWLAHKASHEGVICVERIAGVPGVHPLNTRNIPGCTYSSPQIASIGLTEAAAKTAGYSVRVGKFPYAGNGKAAALGEPEGLIKTVFDAQTGELLGAHMIGAEVTEMIQGYGVARTLETTEAELMHTVFPHPTLSEMMHESVLDAYGRAIHF
ncbi:Dihydrolipoyl dehydrogenase [Azospirillaceae bacterium]